MAGNVAILVEDLDAIVADLGDVDVVVLIDRQSGRCLELARAGAGLAPAEQERTCHPGRRPASPTSLRSVASFPRSGRTSARCRSSPLLLRRRPATAAFEHPGSTTRPDS